MTRDDGYTRYTVRIPTPLYERVKEAAGEKSVNAEILDTLQKAYPPKSIDINLLSDFLSSLIGVSAPDGDQSYLDYINSALSDADQPWTVRAGWDGEISFFPYATDASSKKTPRIPGDDDDARIARKNKP